MKSEQGIYSIVGKKRSLSRRFSFSLSLVVICFLLVFSISIVLYNYFKLKSELDNQLVETLKLAETSLPTAVWQMDYSSMEDILEAILINDAIASVRIISDGQLAVLKNQPEYAGKDFSFFSDSNQFRVESLEVRRKKEDVGIFEVAISQARIKQGVLVTVLSVAGLGITLCVAIIFTSILITRRYIFTPLMRLESHAKLIAGGNLESNIEIEGEDEFAQLAAAFNIMAAQLHQSFETLEQKVMERTADLLLAKNEAEKMSHNLSLAGAELQALLDNSPVGILFTGFDRVIQRINPEVERITGYTRDELIGHSTRILYESGEIFAQVGQINDAILKMRGVCQANADIRCKDGTVKTCYWRGRVVVGEEGIEGVVWSIEDISRRLQMEEELLRVKKLESIGVLAGGIAHDFNNLLFAILGNISLAKRMTTPEGETYELLDSAYKASERARDLTSKLLTFSSGGEPVKAAESLPCLLEESASFVLSGSNVKCTFDFADGLWPVQMDRGQINQVIQNLVVNADQAMPQGGTINIICENVALGSKEIPGLEGGRYVRVQVRDQGVGIREENLGKVFDPYFSTKEKDSNKGSGLGLSIVHSIISKHKGVIMVDSLVNQGSTFTIYLPAINGEATPVLHIDETVTCGKGLILVMDDEDMIRNVVCNMLEHLGYETLQASDGHEALELYKKNRKNGKAIDAVIMDLTIPGGMGGVEATRKILELDAEAKIIVSSGYSHDPVLDHFESFGFCNIVAKPYQLPDLSRVLAATLLS